MRFISGFFILSIISSVAWSYFLLRAANPRSRDARGLAQEIQRTLDAPSRPASLEEVNSLLRELGNYSLTAEASPLEFGFASGSVKKMLIQGPEELIYIRRDAHGRLSLALHFAGGFSWKIWHLAQSLRAGYPAFRHYTFKKPHSAWFEIGAKIRADQVTYADDSPDGGDLLYCFPGCLRAEGQNRESAQKAMVAVPFLFGPRRQIVYSSAELSQPH